ncbi:MAG: helix-turn-helix domain-containing protein [Clostridia bacterium]|nr:helix-turn-helix domain-containing protein [Clostridia bacterium]
MKLQDKIYWCRKKAGLSQDALAEKLDVSRQAVSKWENGEAIPETAKLPSLAAVFGVSIDWLLSDAEPEEEEVPTPPSAEPEEKTEPAQPASDWMDGLPGMLGGIARRFGWLGGVYVAVIGGGITLFGTLAKVISRSMVSSYTSTVESITTDFFPGGGAVQILDEYGNAMDGEMADMVLEAIGGSAPQASSPFGDMMTSQTQLLQNNPVNILANVLIVGGIVAMIGGIVLAVWLRKWGQNKTE